MNPQTPLTNAINYAKANPTSDLAKTIRLHIEDGSFDQQAQKENVDLSVYGRQKVQPVSPITSESQNKEPNILQKGVGLFANPILETGAKAGELAGTFLLKGLDKVTSGTISKLTPEGDLNTALDRVLSQDFKLPITGKTVTAPFKETPEQTAGRALSTVSLGLGSSVLAGGGIMAGQAMEEKGSALNVGVNAIAGMLGAKILSVGFGAAAPYIEKALAKYGTPLLERLQSELPEYAKPALDNLINKGKTFIEQAGKKKFETTIDTGLVPEGGKLAPKDAQTLAWQDIQPKATPTTKAAYAGQKSPLGGRGVSTQGTLSKAELQPTAGDIKPLESYQKLYENGSITKDMPIDKKLDIVDKKAAQLHQEQKSFLAENDKAVNLTDKKIGGKIIEGGEGLYSKLDRVSSESTTIFGRDATAKAAYDSAVDVFKKNLKVGKGTTGDAVTLTKIDEALTAFDKEMEKFGAWERNATGTLTETDKARIQAIRDIHNTARDFISNNLPPNSPWKAIRSEESDMYEILRRMSPKLGDTVGQSKLMEFINAHPSVKKALQFIIPASIIGVGGAELLK